MGKYEEKISDHSLWITSTPTPPEKTLPLYITEAGHFIADCGYEVMRDTHDSFLMIYTIGGQGIVQTGDSILPLSCGNTVVIDCHMPHEYHTAQDKWDFLWIHFNGTSAGAFFDILYPDSVVGAVNMQHPHGFENMISELINKANKNGVANSMDISSGLHLILNSIYLSELAAVSEKKELNHDVRKAIDFIDSNYASPITVDDMIKDIHISKYHFIRSFRRVMGITPYSYLTNHRINMSKTLLRSTDKTVSQIAEECGFRDTSNFITQFKKHTGQKPLQYKRDFS